MSDMSDNSLYLEPLMNHLLLHSSSQEGTYNIIQESLDSSFKIRWLGPEADIKFHALKLGRMTLASLSMGCEVEIFPQIPDNRTNHSHVSLLYPLVPPIECMADNHVLKQENSGIYVCSPLKSSRLHFAETSHLLILRIPASLAYEVMTKTRMLQPGEPLSLTPALDLELKTKPFIDNILNNILFCYERRALSLPFQDAWVQQVEQLVTLFFLQHMHNPIRKPGTSKQLPNKPTSSYKTLNRLEMLENYLKSHLAAPVSIKDMEKISGYSRSHLNKLCLRHLGCPPIVWLRNLRLDAVYTHLLENPRANITEIAMLYGFGHMGRFSGYFYQRFGFHPSSMKKG